MSPRWTKVLRDLSRNRTRTTLALLALTIGAFSVGADLSAWRILTREMGVSFRGTNPPGVIVHVEGAGAERDLARAAEALPGVAQAEPRGLLEGRVLAGPDEWKRLLLFVVDDFAAVRVSTFTSQQGARAPGPGEILLERSAVPFLEKSVGDELLVQTPHGPRRSLRVTGLVHDGAQSPGWMDGIGYGYITRDTLELLGEGRALGELRVVVSAGQSAAAVGQRVQRLVEQRGLPVAFVNAHRAQHPHADQMESLLFLFGAFGGLSLVLGGLLAASVVSTLLRQQVRQIGAMKALGATSAQVAGLYLGAVVLLATAALAVGVPLGAFAGIAYARFVSGVLNFDLTSTAIPGWVYLLQGLTGLLVPLAAAAVPVVRGSRMTVRQAIADYGLAASAATRGAGDPWLSRLPGVGRPLLLSLRNTFRSRGRVALTVGILAVGGATFMTAFSVSDSWRHTVDSLFEARRYDLQVVLPQRASDARLREVLGALPGVARVEPWGSAWARLESARAAEGYRLMLTAVPPDSAMIAFPLLEGRWLRPGDTHAIVINHELRQDPEAGLALGDTVTLDLEGKPSQWTVVGVVRELGVRRRGQNIPASAYVSRAAFDEATGLQGRARTSCWRPPSAGPRRCAKSPGGWSARSTRPGCGAPWCSRAPTGSRSCSTTWSSSATSCWPWRPWWRAWAAWRWPRR